MSRTLTILLTLTFTTALATGQTTIFDAARTGDHAQVLSLLEADPQLVHARTADAETPLHFAAARGHGRVMELLLARGGDPGATDFGGRTPLHRLAATRYAKLVTLLTAHGADVNAADSAAITALHIAAMRGQAALLGELLLAGADVHACDALGRTPLHVVGESLRVRSDDALAALAMALLAAGADPDALDAAGTPAWPPPAEPPLPLREPSGYPLYTEIQATLQQYAADYPDLCEYHELEVPSVQGRALSVLRISANLDQQENEPEMKYISTMHGDEVTGVVMCLNLIDYLLTNYGYDMEVNTLINGLDIWIMPCMNPDGYVAGIRYNMHYVDLNRNFPEGSGSDPDPNTIDGREPETAAVMLWSFDHSFTLAANFHGGSLVVNYPFDNDDMGSVYSPTPDEDLFVYISEEYSRHNLPMWNNPAFHHGITNGAAWYSIDGGMQDWSYRYMGCNEVTIELGTKTPAYSSMPTYWSQNRESMLAYMATCLKGVHGVVTDAYTGDPLAATIEVVGRDHPVYTDPDVGDYHRMLRPGAYELVFSAPGFDPVTESILIASTGVATLDVQLSPAARITFPDGGEALLVDQETTVTWVGNPDAQFHVQQTAHHGDTATEADDFEDGALGPDYQTGGDAAWLVTSADAHGGVYAARAGAIGHNKITLMTRTVTADEVRFWYRVSSEADYDYFNFYIDGVRKVHAAGAGSWVQFVDALAPGPHLLKWEYDKDYSVSEGDDTVYIDDLELVVDNTIWSDIVALTETGVTSAAWTPTTVSEVCKVRARAYYGGSDWGDWDESNETFRVVAEPVYELGDLDCSGLLDFGDINPFVLALSSPDAYAAAYPDCDRSLADCNNDDIVDFRDINPFVLLLTERYTP